MNKRVLSTFLLILTSAIWGFAFVAQSKGLDNIGNFTFSAIRGFVASFAMFLIAKSKSLSGILKLEGVVIDEKLTRKSGIVCGVILFIAMNTQQYGLLYTTTGKAGFITTLYIVIIPIILRIMGNRLSKRMTFCVTLATIGMYILSINESLSINTGDVLVFISAIFYSLHTLSLAKYTNRVDGLKLNTYQFLICSVLSLIVAVLTETIDLNNIFATTIPILYVGVLSSAVAYSLQIIGLRHLDATIVSLINSTEAIFATLGGYLILSEVLSLREWMGCLIIFVATVLAQLPDRKFKKI